ncbi:glycosyltransferase [Gulosibacter bifidus]|uniref:Glycosyltransferase n=1 Tax=Gulosibacter bifidus TaxID=272239 RepID=A0ABW5RI23_9MICO|nr:glycosyltransferase [Gulosibacter bifidus]
MNRTPKIGVLLATHNGVMFVEEQLRSVLDQIDVDVHVVISDDNSTDGTYELVQRLAAADSRITVLPQGTFGSAAANFYRLVRDANVQGFDAIGFCDQDDAWEPWKLERHYALLTSPGGVDGLGDYSAVSSNVAAFDEDGNSQLIVKNQLQRTADYVFESGGPGSTFLFRPETFEFVRAQLLDPASPASRMPSHDWCMYALVRASGRRWFIDGEPSVQYRQHGDNVLGANEGLEQHLARLKAIANGQHRRDVQSVLDAVVPVASTATAPQLAWLQDATRRRGPLTRIRLARQANQLRRRRRDQLALAATVLLGIW